MSHGSDQSSVTSAPPPCPPEGATSAATSAAASACYVCGRQPPLRAVRLPDGQVRCGGCSSTSQRYARNRPLAHKAVEDMRAPLPALRMDRSRRAAIVAALTE